MKDTQLAQTTLADGSTGAIANPIHLSTAYKYPKLGQSTGFDYTRTKNPTHSTLETYFVKLEHGTVSFTTSNGMSAIRLICDLFKPHDEILVPFGLYGGTFRLFEFYEQQYDIKFKYIDFTNYEQVEKEVTDRTVALLIEPISNPQMIAIGVKPYYQLCGARDLLSIIDNTFLTPYLSTPLVKGADIVLHSATKYIGGHNDVLAGVVIVKDESLAQQLFDFHNMTGAALPPIDNYLLLRGLETLYLHVGRAQSNARKLAKRCRSLQTIDEILYSRQAGMPSLRFSEAYSAAKLLENLGIYIFAKGLGGTETLVTFPYTRTHVDMPDAEKDKRGIDEHLIHLSLGVENYEGVKRDIIQALDKAQIGEIV